MRRARRSTVGASKSARSGSSTPTLAERRESTRVARSEWPPSWKKSSWTPGVATPSTSAQMPATSSSTGVRGATWSAPGPRCRRCLVRVRFSTFSGRFQRQVDVIRHDERAPGRLRRRSCGRLRARGSVRGWRDLREMRSDVERRELPGGDVEEVSVVGGAGEGSGHALEELSAGLFFLLRR